jgi:uncharacterized protein (DUF2141 family)
MSRSALQLWAAAGVLLLAAAVSGQAAGKGQVTVDVVGLHSGEGRVLVALYCGEEGFPGQIKKACASQVANAASAKGKRVRMVFEGVAAGEFAVSMFHDENSNSNLDRNFLGIPKEGWGTSRDAKANFGPPSYADARLPLKAGEHKQIVVHVQY